MDIVPTLLVNHTSSDLILNDYFVRIIKDKKQTCTFHAPYDDIVAFFLSKMSSFYFIILISFMSYKVSLILDHVIIFLLQIVIFIHEL